MLNLQVPYGEDQVVTGLPMSVTHHTCGTCGWPTYTHPWNCEEDAYFSVYYRSRHFDPNSTYWMERPLADEEGLQG